jgi:23S rRNA maturation mini-RNase III
MKKLGKANESRRRAESQALFLEMMKNPHLVVTPQKYKGSRQSKNAKAIRESQD